MENYYGGINDGEYGRALWIDPFVWISYAGKLVVKLGAWI